MNTLANCTKAVRNSKIFWLRHIYASTSTSASDERKSNDEEEKLPLYVEEVPEEETPLPAFKFDKSRLLPQHRNMLHEKLPYSEPQSWIHLSEKYQRKMFGRYGSASGVNPRICFDTQHDIKRQKSYEHVAYPHTLPEMIATARAKQAERVDKVKQREEEIAKKLEKLEQWKKDLNAKIAKKEADIVAAKERKERLVEEVRRHFGFNVDPRDERFTEMLEQKEKEDRKKQKEAKRMAKEEKMLAKLQKSTS